MTMNSGGRSAGLKASRGECVMSDLGRLGALTGLETECAVNQIEGNGVLRHMNNQGTISYPFMLLLFILFLFPGMVEERERIPSILKASRVVVFF